MEFTYLAYEEMIQLLKQHKYVISDYKNYKGENRCVILRHDVDYDLKKALSLAEFENSLGVKSTYFVLLTSDFYNILSCGSQKILNRILNLGHDVGLHFDEMNYPNIAGQAGSIKEKILMEANLLGNTIGRSVESVSMHRPSKRILEANLSIPGLINSYSDEFFHGFKYLSDSRRTWREPVEETIKSEQFKKLHILTHAFWYEEKSKDIKSTIKDFVLSGNLDRYDILDENITDLQSILKRECVI